MKKIIEWLNESDRWKHLVLGMLIGLGANSLYCAAYAGGGAAFTAELKDKLWGGEPDWIDFTVTVAGVAVGYGLRCLFGTIFGKL